MATKTIAAYNSPAEKKAIADYVCDGTGDHSEIIQAINASQSGDTVLLYEGTYNLAGSIFPKGGTTFKGEGVALTKLNLVGSSHIFIDYENVTVEDFFFSHTDSPDSDKWLGGFIVRASYAKINRVNGWADQKTAAVFHTLSSSRTPTAPLQYVEYQDCVVDGAYTYPFLHNWWDGDTAKKTHKNIKYIRCKALNCGNVAQPQQPYSTPAGTGPYRFNEWVCGFDFAETNDIDSLYVKECESSGNWESGFHAEWDRNKTSCVFEDCIAKNNGKKPNYPNETANPFYGFRTNTGEFFGSGFYLPNFNGRLERCYTEANSRCGYWVTNGGTLVDCVDKDCGKGRSGFTYVQPASFFGNPCRSGATPNGYALELIRCKSVNSACYGFDYDSTAKLRMVDCQLINPTGKDGVGSYLGNTRSDGLKDSIISFARIEAGSGITAIRAHNNINVQYGPGVLVSDASKPFTITGASTSGVKVQEWTTVSQTLAVGSGGVTVEEGASVGQVTLTNVEVTREDPAGGDPPVDNKLWIPDWKIVPIDGVAFGATELQQAKEAAGVPSAITWTIDTNGAYTRKEVTNYGYWPVPNNAGYITVFDYDNPNYPTQNASGLAWPTLRYGSCTWRPASESLFIIGLRIWHEMLHCLLGSGDPDTMTTDLGFVDYLSAKFGYDSAFASNFRNNPSNYAHDPNYQKEFYLYLVEKHFPDKLQEEGGPDQTGWVLGYQYRHRFDIPTTNIDDLLTNVAIPISLSGSTFSGLFSAIGNDWKKIKVVDEDGTSLPVEVVQWDSTYGDAELYVRVPKVYATRTTSFYLYYDSSAGDNPDIGLTGSSAAQAVWSGLSMLGAWHGYKDPNAAKLLDSTANARHMPVTGAVEYVVDAGNGRRMVKYDKGEWADTLIPYATLNSATQITVEATVALHSLNTGVWNEQMWFGQNSPSGSRFFLAAYGNPPKWAAGIGDKAWSANDSPPCNENLTHIAWVIDKSAGTAKLYVNGALIETKTFTWANLNRSPNVAWAIAQEGSGAVGYAANIKFYDLRVSQSLKSAAYVKALSHAERGTLLSANAVEEYVEPVVPDPAPWADSRYRYRREFTISGAAAITTVPQVPLRIPLLRSVPSGADMANYPIVDRMIPSMSEFIDFFNSWCITDADGNLKHARWVVYPTTGTSFNMPCLTWEAYFAPKIEPGVQNRFYLYYTPEYVRNDYTGGDAIAWPPGTTDHWDDSGPEYYTLIDQHFAFLLHYSDDRYNQLNDIIITSEMATQTFTMGLDVLGGHAPPYRVCDPVLGNGLRVGQAYSYPFTLGRTYRVASGEIDVYDPDTVAQEQERLRTKWHDVTGALTVEIVLKLNELPVPPEGEWKYIVPISKGWAADSGGSWTLAIRDTGEGYFMVRKPDNSGWINNVNAFGPIPLNERVYIACVFAPNDHITVYTYCPGQGFRKTSSSAAGVSGSYRSEHMGGINVPYAYDYMNGVVYMASISKVARSESWIKMRALAYTDSIMDIFTLGEEEERVDGVTAEITATAHTTRIVAEALTPETTGIREVVARIRRLVAVATAYERVETAVVTGKVKRVIAVAYADIEGVSGAISHVKPVTAFTDTIAYSNRVQVVKSFIRSVKGVVRSYGVPYVEPPSGPGVFAAEDLQIEVRDNDGALIAILDNAHNIRIVQEDNAPTILEFDLPADDRKGDNLTLANEIWIRSIKTGGIVAKFKLHKKTDTRGI